MACSELHHPNVNPFIGCIVESNFTAVMTNYCSRRSLKTILTNSEFTLDCLFKLSFISDAAMGLHYLHNKRIVHERLHLNNCLVDEYWTLKLSGSSHCMYYLELCKCIHCISCYIHCIQIIALRYLTTKKFKWTAALQH